ncbi:TPA: DinB family protein [Bacillus pseudomycoides]|nr:DinB family protein [Bacillus pseudomycoides]
MAQTSIVEYWKYYSYLTNGLLEHLSSEDLSFRPYESMKTLGEELRHIADAREIYLRAMMNKRGPSWREKQMDSEMAVNLDKLKAYYRELEKGYKLFTSSQIEWERTVIWEEMNDPNIEKCFNWLVHFECTHQGIVSVYLTGLHIDYDISS